MKVELLILSCLKDRFPGIAEEDKLLLGISQYAKDNNIGILVKEGQTIETSKLILSAFLEPFFNMSFELVKAYFYNYDLISEFKTNSKIIFELASQKRNSGNKILLSKEMEEKIVCCISNIYSKKELESVFSTEISDIILEIDYLKGKTDKFSLRTLRME